MAGKKTIQCKHGLDKRFCGICHPDMGAIASLVTFAKKHSDLNTLNLAKLVVKEMTDSQKTKLLLHLLKSHFDQIKRQEVHSIEKSASLWEEEKRERRREYQENRKEEERQAAEAPWRALSITKNWQKWDRLPPVMKKLRITQCDPDYAAWLESHGDKQFTSDLTTYCSYRSQILFDNFERDMRRKITLELTQELLGAHFALPNGLSTTWGEATAADHQSRIEYLLIQASGTVTTANRHKAAIEILREHHANNLNEVAQEMPPPPASEVGAQRIERVL